MPNAGVGAVIAGAELTQGHEGQMSCRLSSQLLGGNAEVRGDGVSFSFLTFRGCLDCGGHLWEVR